MVVTNKSTFIQAFLGFNDSEYPLETVFFNRSFFV